MVKQVRRMVFSLVTLTGAGAHAVELPTTPTGLYAVGEQMGQCAAFLTFLSKGFAKEGNQNAAQQLARQRVNWTLASVVYLGMGQAKDATSAAQSIEDAEASKLQARFDGNAPTVINDMIADHRRQCDQWESSRDAAVSALKDSFQPAK